MSSYPERENNKMQNDVILEFLEVAFNAILHSRKIYPSVVFVLKRKYGIPVQISTHPRITNYIVECLKTVKQLLEWNSLQHIVIAISSNDAVVERHVFEIMPGSDGDDDGLLLEIEETFRVYLLRLSVSSSTLPMLPDDVTFSIQLVTSAQSSVQLNDSISQANFPWIEADKLPNDTSIENVIVPLKTYKSNNFGIQMFIETCQAL